MKLAYLTEVAALLASHHRLFIEDSRPLPNQTAGDYYILSRNRLNRWMRDLNDTEAGVPITDPLHLPGLSSRHHVARSLAEQVLINEMLTRIWTVMLVARDRFRRENRLEPLAHNVFLGQLTVRHRALSVCLNQPGLTADDVVAIDRLRRGTERWTDLLNCALMNAYDLWSYAFDEDQARDFLKDRREQQSMDSRSHAWILILAGLRHSFPDTDSLGAPLHEDDRRIVRLMLTAFPDNSRDSSYWMMSQLRRARAVS